MATLNDDLLKAAETLTNVEAAMKEATANLREELGAAKAQADKDMAGGGASTSTTTTTTSTSMGGLPTIPSVPTM